MYVDIVGYYICGHLVLLTYRDFTMNLHSVNSSNNLTETDLVLTYSYDKFAWINSVFLFTYFINSRLNRAVW